MLYSPKQDDAVDLHLCKTCFIHSCKSVPLLFKGSRGIVHVYLLFCLADQHLRPFHEGCNPSPLDLENVSCNNGPFVKIEVSIPCILCL